MLIRALFSCKRSSSRDPNGVLPHPSAYALGNVQFCHLFTLTSLHSSSPFLPYNKHNVHSHGTNSVVRLKGSSPFHLPLFYSLQTTQMFIMSSFFYTVFCLCLWHFSEKKGKESSTEAYTIYTEFSSGGVDRRAAMPWGDPSWPYRDPRIPIGGNLETNIV